MVLARFQRLEGIGCNANARQLALVADGEGFCCIDPCIDLKVLLPTGLIGDLKIKDS